MSSTGSWTGVNVHLVWLLWFMDSARAQYGITYREPRLECLPDGIRLHIDPVGIFVGHVYVRGHFNGERCHLNYCTKSMRQPFYMDVPYRGSCNIRRHRSPHPMTVTYEVTVVIQHHPLFITAGDRAYRLNCIYRQTEASLTQQISVNDPSPTAIQGKSTPQCHYDVLASVNGPSLRFANVGDPVIHKWRCDSDLHGFVVHSCVVRDPAGAEYRLIDDRGCVIEKQLVPEVSYAADLSSAYTTINAFRFAEQIVVHFSCQITLCRKQEQGCEGIAPPVCHPVDFPPIQAIYRHSTAAPVQTTSVPVQSSRISVSPRPTADRSGSNLGETYVRSTVRPTTTSTLSNKIDSEGFFNTPVDSVKSQNIPSSTPFEDHAGSNAVSNGDKPEYGLEISKITLSPYQQLPEVPKDYRTETLSSVYDLPVGYNIDPLPRPVPAQIFFANSRKARSHKPGAENITLEVEAKKILVFSSDDSDRMDVSSLPFAQDEPILRPCNRAILSQTIFLGAAALLQASSIAVILIQRRLYKRNIEELLLRLPSKQF